MDERTLANITDGTRLRYRGKTWSPTQRAHVMVDSIYVAVDGIDKTEYGTALPVVVEEAYGWDEAEVLLIYDFDIYKIEILPDTPEPEPSHDRFGRTWRLPEGELCKVCGQPDNCGDCTHVRLPDEQVTELGGVVPPYVAIVACHDVDHRWGENWATVHGPFATEEEATHCLGVMARQELLTYHEDDESLTEQERADEATERTRINNLSDDAAIGEHNDELGESGCTVHTGSIYPWKEKS